jgi:hypothetical protein
MKAVASSRDSVGPGMAVVLGLLAKDRPRGLGSPRNHLIVPCLNGVKFPPKMGGKSVRCVRRLSHAAEVAVT